MLMREIENQQYLREEQYKDAGNLKARLALHENFGIGARPWHLWVFDHLLHLPAEARVLELGCGPGTLWAKNAGRIPKGWHIMLSDFSAGMLEEARAKLGNIDHHFEFAQVDAQDIPFEDGTFDAVVANHMLYHVPDRPKAFSEIARILRTGGRFFAATNGSKHMRELEQLTAEMGFEMPGGHGPTGFDLENGAAQLEAYFDLVKLHTLEDGLRVTRAKPIVAYLKSYPSQATDQTFAALAKRVGEVIAKEGAFAITKESGLFGAAKR